MAAKLARLIYRMLRYGAKYVDRGTQFYEVQQRTRQIRSLKQKSHQAGIPTGPSSGRPTQEPREFLERTNWELGATGRFDWQSPSAS
jgi:hypothetical protein